MRIIVCIYYKITINIILYDYNYNKFLSVFVKKKNNHDACIGWNTLITINTCWSLFKQ